MDKGHKQLLSAVLAKLNDIGFDSAKIWQDICECIVKSLLSVQPVLAHTYRSCQPCNVANNMCFQVLGFDIMLNRQGKAFLLQVNHTPSFTTDTPIDLHVKQSLLKDSVVLVHPQIESITGNRQIIQRTLTSKKTWRNRQERAALVNYHQKIRDQWEESHLGQFQKVFPSKETAINERYMKLLESSADSYLALTGGNIIRNAKPQHTQEIDKESKPQKLTNSQLLERIYIKKPKLMQAPSIKKTQQDSRPVIDSKPTIDSRPMTKSASKKQAPTPPLDAKYLLKTTGNKQANGTSQLVPALFRRTPYNSIDKINANRNNNMGKTQSDDAQLRAQSAKLRRTTFNRIYNAGFKQMKMRL